MAKAKKKHRRRNGLTIPLAVVGGFGPGVARTIAATTSTGFTTGMYEASRIYTGYDPATGSFNFANMKYGTGPALLGVLVHKFIGGKLGINRVLAGAGIPLLRL
jgi:hypothetical protein